MRFLREGEVHVAGHGDSIAVSSVKADSMTTGEKSRPKNKKARTEPLRPDQSRKLVERAAKDPEWKNKTTGAKKI